MMGKLSILVQKTDGRNLAFILASINGHLFQYQLKDMLAFSVASHVNARILPMKFFGHVDPFSFQLIRLRIGLFDSLELFFTIGNVWSSANNHHLRITPF